MKRLDVEVADCDPARIDWPSLMRAAGLRLPPFDPDPEKEKGFKDVVIGETFVQMCRNFPAYGTDTAILVTNDEMLGQHVLRQIPRAKVVKNADALANELNVLGSDLDPLIASQLPNLASDLLIRHSPRFWEEVWKMAAPQIQSQVDNLSGVTNARMLSPVWGHPIFVKKHLKHVYFACRYEIPRQGQQWMPAIQAVPTGALPTGDPVSPASSALSPFGSGFFGSTFGTSNFGAAPSPQVPDPVTHPIGQYQGIQLPSLIFTVNWRADFKLPATEPIPVLSHPFIESVKLEPM